MANFNLRANDPNSGSVTHTPVDDVRNALQWSARNHPNRKVELWRGDVKVANLSSMQDGFWSIS